MSELWEIPILELLKAHGSIESELKRRGFVGKRGDVVGPYAEALARGALGLVDLGHNYKGADAEDPLNPQVRYQIKGRREDSLLGAIKRIHEREFDYLVGVVFHDDFTVLRAAMVSYDVLVGLKELRKTVNGHQLSLTNTTLRRDGVEDISDRLRAYQAEASLAD